MVLEPSPIVLPNRPLPSGKILDAAVINGQRLNACNAKHSALIKWNS